MLEHGMLKTPISSGSPSYSPVTDFFGDSSGKALYRFDGNANDESGNYHGTATAITYGGGQYERGAVVTSTSSTIYSNIVTPTEFTISIWANIPSYITNTVIYDISNGGPRAYLQASSTQLTFYTTPLTTLPPVNQWNNIVFTYSASTLKYYLNGALSQTSTSTIPTAALQSAMLGNYLGSYTLTGNYDQFRIFSRAITASEVTQLYAEVEPTSIVNDTNPFMDGSLKALYKFENDATDATGTYNGTATNVTYGTGKFGSGAVLALASKIQTGYIVQPSTSFSISGWVKSSTTTHQYMFGAGITATWLIFASDASTPTRYTLYVGSGGGSWSSIVDCGLRTLGGFDYITVTLQSGIGYKIYINGTYKGASAAYTLTTTMPLVIGDGYNATAASTLAGTYDQFRIFNKALTPLEVAALYNETTPLENPMHSLVDPFRDGSGKALYRLEGNVLDESGNYNGTPTAVTYGVSTTGREAIFNGSASITATLTLTTNTFSYSVWATVTTVSSTIQSLIDFSTGRAMLSSGNGTNAYVSYYDGTSYRVFSAYALTSATRTHIGLAVNGTSVELFINGVSQGTSTCNTVTPSGTIAFGKYGGSAAGYLTGKEDQPRVFNRVLSASEFQQLYTNQA